MQVKTLSFLTYLLRGYVEFMRPHHDSIPRSVVMLLKACPHENGAVRKELLVATRHILATEFRNGFFAHVDVFLDEKLLLGNGRAPTESLRPLAYSLLAEVVHHVRLELSIPQLSKAVHLFSRNVHDLSLPLSVQSTSIRLLMNLVEGIYHKNSEAEGKGRALLVRILDTFVKKFGTLKEYIPKLQNLDKNGLDEEAWMRLPGAHQRSGASLDIQVDIAKEYADCKQLIKTLIVGMRTVVWSVSNLRTNTAAKGMIEEECLIAAKLVKNGLKCFRLYSSAGHSDPKEEKEILDLFAGVFTVLDPRTFQDIFSLKIGILLEHVLENQAMLTVPQHLLANSNVSRMFADILLNSIVSRLRSLSGPDSAQASILLRLFKIVFGAVTLFPENELVLRPHLSTLVNTCLKNASEEKDPLNYLHLLKALFRSIGVGKFEQLHKEFLPLLKLLLESLLRLLAAANKKPTRDLLVELCLTVPARLNFMLPYLHLLIRPVVYALGAGADLANLGLKVLESWVENLSPNFLDPLLASVAHELLPAIYMHLKPAPHPFGVVALRILGKLGGRNRRSLRHPQPLEFKETPIQGMTLNVRFDSAGTCMLPLDLAIKSASDIVLNPAADVKHRSLGVRFIKAVVLSLLPAAMQVDQETARLDSELRNVTDVESSSLDTELSSGETATSALVMRKEIEAQCATLQMMYRALFSANAAAELKPELGTIIDDLAAYAAVNCIQQIPRPSNSGLLPPELDPMILIRAIVETVCSEHREMADEGVRLLEVFLDNVIALAGSKEAAAKLRFVDELVKLNCNCCYQRAWWQKSGGCIGLRVLIARLPVAAVRKDELRFVRALLFLMKDLPPPRLRVGLPMCGA